MTYSSDAHRIVNTAYQSVRSIRKTAALTGVAKSTVHRWLVSSRHPRTRHLMHRTAFKKASLSVLIEICKSLDACGHLRPSDLKCIIASKLKKDLSVSCVRFWMRRAGYTRKKASVEATKDGLIAQQRAFCEEHMQYVDPERVVSIDETSICFDMKPVYGYSHKSKRFRATSRAGERHRWTLIMAVTNERVVGWKLHAGATCASTFADFLSTLDTDGRDVLLLDNVSFHKTSQVLQVIDDRNCTPLFLPPYTPCLQPIEHCFAILKAAHRRSGSPAIRSLAAMQTRMQQLLAAILGPHVMHGIFQTCWKRGREMASGQWWTDWPAA